MALEVDAQLSPSTTTKKCIKYSSDLSTRSRSTGYTQKRGRAPLTFNINTIYIIYNIDPRRRIHEKVNVDLLFS